MIAVSAISNDEEFEVYKEVISRCTGEVDVHGLKVHILEGGELSPSTEAAMHGRCSQTAKGNYYYLYVRGHESEIESFVRIFKNSFHEREGMVLDMVASDEVKEEIYILTVAQPIALYREDRDMVVVCDSQNLLFGKETFDAYEMSREIESEMEYELDREDAEYEAQTRVNVSEF